MSDGSENDKRKTSVDLEIEEILNAPWNEVPDPLAEHPYIRELNAGLERAKRAEEKRVAKEQAARRSRELAPLEERLKRHIARTYTEAEQREGLSLPILQASLKGRQKEHASASELGGCLRRLGFVRRRRWTGSDGFRAVWRKEN